MGNYPEFVPRDEKPEKTVETVSEDVLEGAVSIAVSYGKCPECDEGQFYNVVPGHNSTHECVECGRSMRIVG